MRTDLKLSQLKTSNTLADLNALVNDAHIPGLAAAPVAGDDGFVVKYNHTAGGFELVAEAGGGGGGSWGSITGTLADQTDLQTALDGKLSSGANISTLTNDTGFITDYSVTEADVTAHQAALSIAESQISDLGSYLSSGDNISELVNDAGYITDGYWPIDGTVNTTGSTIINANSATSDLVIGSAIDRYNNMVFNANDYLVNSQLINFQSNAGSFHVELTGNSRLLFSGLPTADPAFATQVWNDGGALKVSAG